MEVDDTSCVLKSIVTYYRLIHSDSASQQIPDVDLFTCK